MCEEQAETPDGKWSMKEFFRYLYRCRRVVICALLCAAVLLGILSLYGVSAGILWYPLLLCSILCMGTAILGFAREHRRHRELKRILKGGVPFADMLPQAESILEEDYRELVREAEKRSREDRTHWEELRRDTEDYYAVWMHQIKAPIAVMRVLLQQADTPENQELRAELFRIEQYVEMALCYVRLGEGASDLVIQEYELDQIIRRAVRKYAGQFIRKKIRLVYEGTKERVLTDEKWLSFIIEQLLSNAVKYTAAGTVTITVTEDKKLSVEDTGIGIEASDLPRIFEKGYTGRNGRTERKSTGIGLYLAKTAAGKLGHQITAQSRPGEGSRFTVDLDAYPFQAE